MPSLSPCCPVTAVPPLPLCHPCCPVGGGSAAVTPVRSFRYIRFLRSLRLPVFPAPSPSASRATCPVYSDAIAVPLLSRPRRNAAPAVPWAAALPPSPPPVHSVISVFSVFSVSPFSPPLHPSPVPPVLYSAMPSPSPCCPATAVTPSRPSPASPSPARLRPSIRDPSAPRILRFLRNIRSPARLPPQRPRAWLPFSSGGYKKNDRPSWMVTGSSLDDVCFSNLRNT